MPRLSVLIPASNEEALIRTCLEAVVRSAWHREEPFETIVISNGSRDRTVAETLALERQFSETGLDLRVLEREEGGKLAALNAGDAVARGDIRVYLDADVEVSKNVLSQVFDALDTEEPRYASGTLVLAEADSWATRAYARIYEQVPFMRHGVPGAGLFAVNSAGRTRWAVFPDIISDDTFVRLSFRPEERVSVPATYTWPLVEGWPNLVRVRRRQNAGVDEIREVYPELLGNDDKPAFTLRDKLKLALQDPIGFAVYAGVAMAVRLPERQASGWTRGR
ncbi:glycosyltransferase family 2 protein [Marivita sp. XM-24bin2]|jgi:glycosyltransferase involved in cell wall biosynthesis|uniref:glycosyltransferase family 2 protein n=1 Tax=unclassified Marivita TaxID=2632480 RepID=UPI000D793FBD|nr:glycosyltransferase family 2 protein [Marivita sp. XM-24bin2]MCR9111334.1 glycosyltransferase [Paracoccaceae bacterium]PWL36257.1 MAG: glycosyl transferase [Marivita sp. XM-24bin2]